MFSIPFFTPNCLNLDMEECEGGQRRSVVHILILGAHLSWMFSGEYIRAGHDPAASASWHALVLGSD